MRLSNFDRLETYQKLAQPIQGPVWIDTQLNIPKLWQRVILSIFGRFECVRRYFNINYDYVLSPLRERRVVFQQSGDARLIKIFNAAVSNINKAQGNWRLSTIPEPAERDSYELTAEDAFTLQRVLSRHKKNADELLTIESYGNPEMNTAEGLKLLLERCPNLRGLHFDRYDQISHAQFLVLVEYAGRITKLTLPSTLDLSDEDLELLQQFRHLKQLHLGNFSNDGRLAAVIAGMHKESWQDVYIQGATFTEDQLAQMPATRDYYPEPFSLWKLKIVVEEENDERS